MAISNALNTGQALSTTDAVQFGSVNLISTQVASGSPTVIDWTGLNVYPWNTLKIVGWGQGSAQLTLIAQFATGGGAIDTGNNYSTQLVQSNNNGGNPTNVNPVISNGLYLGELSGVANYSGTLELVLPNWNNASFYKVSHSTCGNSNSTAAGSYLQHCAGVWKNAGAITGIRLTAVAGGTTFTTGSRFSLYGQ